MLARGRVPIFEPGLESMVIRHVPGHLRFTPISTAAWIRAIPVIAVGTPQR